MPDKRQYDATLPGARDPDVGSGGVPAGGGRKRRYGTLKVPNGQRPTFVVWDYYGTEQTRWAPLADLRPLPLGSSVLQRVSESAVSLSRICLKLVQVWR